MAFRDLFSGHAELYASARPTYPAELFGFIASIAPARDRAWDCATGNGQAALGLAAHFHEVQATDASSRQIEHACAHPRVVYSVQPAETTDFAPSSFDAVAVAQALHWFDHAPFFREVHRVLKAGGVFVAWTYNRFSVDPEFDEALERLVLEPIRPFWAARNALSWNGYRDVPFPFAAIEPPALEIRVDWTLLQLVAFLNTWSAVRRCVETEGPAFLDRAEIELRPLWGDPDRVRRVTMPLHIRAGRLQSSV